MWHYSLAQLSFCHRHIPAYIVLCSPSKHLSIIITHNQLTTAPMPSYCGHLILKEENIKCAYISQLPNYVVNRSNDSIRVFSNVHTGHGATSLKSPQLLFSFPVNIGLTISAMHLQNVCLCLCLL